MNQSSEEDKLAAELVEAIQNGNVRRAKKLVAKMSMLHLKLKIQLPQDYIRGKDKGSKFEISVYVEDREQETPTKIKLIVHSSDSISDLKRKVWLKYNFPAELQKWIVGKRMPDDNTTLKQCGVSGQGHTLYLYLKTAQNENFPLDQSQGGRGRGLTAEESSEQQINLLPLRSNLAYEGGKRSDALLMDAASNFRLSQSFDTEYSETTPPTYHTTGSTPHRLGEQDLPPPIPARKPLQKTSVDYLMQIIPPASTPRREEKINHLPGWSCPACTFHNFPTRPGCQMCSTSRPAEYQLPEDYEMTEEELSLFTKQDELERLTRQNEETMRRDNFQHWQLIDELDLIPNSEEFTCPICFDNFEPNEGVVLRDCMHQFCQECLEGAVRHSEEPVLKCPYQDNAQTCDSILQEREVRALVPPDVFVKYLQRGLDQAESQAPNSFHCKTTDCMGWCLYEDEVNFFLCMICNKQNCLTCKVIHEGMNCKEYQADLAAKATNNQAARQTQQLIEQMVLDGSAMHCPQCQIIVQKKDGCDWLKCSVCKTEICWVTKGPRWGPKGNGDTSGGCRCRVDGVPCHPNCGNCH